MYLDRTVDDLQRDRGRGDLDGGDLDPACRLPVVSISHAVLSVKSRTISISIRDSAIQSWMLAG